MSLKNNPKWQQILLNQRLANTKQWIKKLENADDRANLVNHEYENILRALESTLTLPDSQDLSFQLIQLLHPVVVDYADWKRWLVYLERLLTLLPPQENFKKAMLLVEIGDVKGKMGNLLEAEKVYKEGITAFEQGKNKNRQAFSMGRLAIVYAQKGELKEAIKLCQKALALAQATNDLVTYSQIQLNLSYIYFHAQNLKLSLESAKVAYRNFNKLNMQKDAIKALLNIVAISNEMGHWSDVEIQTRSLIHNLDNTGDITTLSQLKNILGVAAFNQEKYMSAESSWHEALLLHTQMNDSAEVAGIYNNLGMVYTKLNEWRASREMFVKAIETYDELGDIYYKANAQDNLADLYYEQQDYTEACKILEIAIAELKRIDQTPHVKQLKGHIEEKLTTFRASCV